jgi:cytochrome c553
MKNILLLALIVVVTGLYRCTPQTKVEYNIPDNYEGQTRLNLIKMLDEGQQLYKIHCSRCHGIFTKGKDSITNFSKTQIENYQAAALMDDPKNHAVIQRIRTEDLDLILMFLRFRKKSTEPLQ